MLGAGSSRYLRRNGKAYHARLKGIQVVPLACLPVRCQYIFLKRKKQIMSTFAAFVEPGEHLFGLATSFLDRR